MAMYNLVITQDIHCLINRKANIDHCLVPTCPITRKSRSAYSPLKYFDSLSLSLFQCISFHLFLNFTT